MGIIGGTMTPSEAISTLIAAGWTEAQIGAEVTVRQSTINKIKRGVVPNWETGDALVALAERVASEKPSTATDAGTDVPEAA